MKKKKVLNFEKNILIRVSESEHKKFKQYAEKNGTTISNLLRDYIHSINKNV